MKNKEEIKKEYVDYLYGKAVDLQMYAPEILQTKLDFNKGWNSAEQKLEQIAKQLQKEDITSVVYALREVIKRMKE